MARALGTPLDGVDVLLVDLDGVIYRGEERIPHAVESLTEAARGVRLGYVTNNASRTDEAVCEQLRAYGLELEPRDVVTSPQAAVRLVADLIEPGAAVLVVGGDGIVVELEKAGYRVVRSADESPAAVVQGYAAHVGWRDLAEASYALAVPDAGEALPWVATNTDWTLPTSRGLAPGNGTLVSAVHSAVGRLPVVAGKPEAPLYEEAVARFGAERPLFVGDRLETDILGARGAGIPSLHVLTGVDGAKQLLAATPERRPDFVVEDLRGLHEPYPRPRVDRGGGRARVGDADVRLEGDRVRVARRGSRIDTLRAACALVWGSGRPIYGLEIPAELYER